MLELSAVVTLKLKIVKGEEFDEGFGAKFPISEYASAGKCFHRLKPGCFGGVEFLGAFKQWEEVSFYFSHHVVILFTPYDNFH
jgi:hypothetical protein